LREILKKKVTLIDYENIRDKSKNAYRYLGFGRFAGIVGCYNTLSLYLKLQKKQLLPRAFEINSYKKIKELISKQNFNKLKKNNKVAMFCTGGIRCEKASNFLKQKGFKNVFQLKGGILNYLNKINIKKSLWKGECFVFDNRVSVKHKLSLGSYSMCRGCRMPISVQEKKSSKYKEGISCPYCYNKLTKSQKDRFLMRQKQILIARKFNKAHIYQKEY